MSLKIDFYLAKQATFEQCLALCYDLIVQQYQQKHDITILFNELRLAQQLDQKLWCKQPDSFIPHQIDQKENKINIHRPASSAPKIQCNMQVTKTTLLDGISHLIQIVPNNESDKQHARVLYKQFAQLGHHITLQKDA